MSEIVYGHLRPDLIEKLVDAVTNLIWAKQQVLDLFRNAGVPDSILTDFQERVSKDRNAVKKPVMIRTLLQRMNDAGDAPDSIRMRREFVKRVVEWKSYSTCQPGCEDVARGAVAAVREIAGSYDFLTEIRADRDKQQNERIREVHAAREATARSKAEWEAIKHEFMACFGISDRSLRGRTFEAVMNRLFVHAKLATNAPFTVYGESGKPLEQIDGSIDLDGSVYIIEIKWWEGPVEQKELSAFAGKVFMRSGSNVRGLFVSASPYTEGAIAVAKEAYAKERPILLLFIKEFFDVLNADGDVREFLRRRIRLMADRKQVTPD